MVNKGKRKNEYQTASTSKRLDCLDKDENNPFSNIPHEVLLQIFKFLSINERCQMARVCKSWLKASYDELTWKYIDLTSSLLNLKQLWKLIRHRCFGYARSIKICGNLKTVNLNLTKQSVSRALMQKLTEICKGLNKLEIQYSDLNSVEVSDLPSNLKELSLVRCEIPVRWFKGNKFQDLNVIDLSGSSRICTTHIRDFGDDLRNTLNVLKLRNCYRIDDKTIEHIIETEFKFIIKLDLQGTVITQYGLQLISSRMASLEYLNLSDCKNLKKGDVALAQAALESVNIIFA